MGLEETEREGERAGDVDAATKPNTVKAAGTRKSERRVGMEGESEDSERKGRRVK